MSEYIIQVDETDRIIGKIDRLDAHRGDGILHRGLSLIVQNTNDEILLTQRSKERPDLNFPPPFPEFWDITMAGHPRWGQEDYVAQMRIELNEELGIEVESSEIKQIGKFQYHVPDPTYPNSKTGPNFRLSEFEICSVGIVETYAAPKINLDELGDSMWVGREELEGKINSLKIAPWAIIMLQKFGHDLRVKFDFQKQ